MPDNPTTLDTIESSASAASFTSASISPTGGALLVVLGDILSTGGTLEVSSVTDTLSGTGTWTIVQATNTTLQRHTGFIAYAVAGSTPGSGTITVNATTNSIRTSIAFTEVTGQDSTTPVLQSISGTGEAATLEITFGSSMASDSMVFAVGASRTNNSDPDVTPGTGFTELQELYSGGSFAQAHLCLIYDNGGADTTVDWSDMPLLSNVGVAIEIATAAGGVTAKNLALLGVG